MNKESIYRTVYNSIDGKQGQGKLKRAEEKKGDGTMITVYESLQNKPVFFKLFVMTTSVIASKTN